MEDLDGMSLAQEGERLYGKGNFKAAIGYLELALKRGLNADNASLKVVSVVYSQLGSAYFELKNYDMALHYYQLDVKTAIFRLLQDDVGLAKAHGNLGIVYKATDDFENALKHAKQYLSIAQRIGDEECEGRALYDVASVLYYRAKARLNSSIRSGVGNVDVDQASASELRSAVNYYLQNLKIVESSKDRRVCGQTYGNLGNCYYLLGDYKTAVELYNKRLSLAQSFGDRAAVKRTYTNLGNAFIFLEQTSKAVVYYRLALDVAVELKDELGEAKCCFNAGNASAAVGDHPAEYHTRCLRLSRKLQNKPEETKAYASLAEDYRNLGDWKKAAYFYGLGIELAFKTHDHATENALRKSFECLCRSNINNEDMRDLFEFDPSADPEPRSFSQLKASLKSLLRCNDCSDCGLSRRSINDLSTFTTDPDEGPHCVDSDVNGDFIELLSRVQCRRINDQRCDPDMLAHSTDGTNEHRKTDTSAYRSGDGFEDGYNSTHRFRRRFSIFFGKLGKSRFRPSASSTPLRRPAFAQLPAINTSEIDNLFSNSNSDDALHLDSGSVKSDNTSKPNEEDSYSTVSSLIIRVPLAAPQESHPICSSTVSLNNGINSIQTLKH
uniref:TPR_REGION domain-containing protein n=1 Tax=Syphacia muris TaxID=451379 RepID=A0A158R4R0_9BILA